MATLRSSEKGGEKGKGEFVNVIKRSPLAQRIPFQAEAKPAGLETALKIFFSAPTLLSMGAVVQIVMMLTLPSRVAMLPAVLYILVRLMDTSLQAASVTPNRYMSDVVPGKVSAQLPSTDTGRFGSTAAAHPVVVFLIAARINHPLGPLAPAVSEFTAYASAMERDLQKNTDRYGCIGFSTWNGQARATSNELLSIYYFRDLDGLHQFAHSDIHRKGWDSFNKAKPAHISILHEAFCVPAGAYESIYINSPATLLGAASIKVTNAATGEQEWVSPLVNANKGPLRSQFGRMTGQMVQGKDEYLEFAKQEPEWSGQAF